MTHEKVINSSGVNYLLEANGLKSKDGVLSTVLSISIPDINKKYTSNVIVSDTRNVANFIQLASRQLGVSEVTIERVVFEFLQELLAKFYSISEPVKLQLLDDPTHKFLVKDFILENAFNLVFARGGSGKSFVSLLIALALQNAEYFQSLQVFKPMRKVNVLYLDWESDAHTLSARFTKVVNGLFIDKHKLEAPYYLQLTRPLHEQIADLIRYVEAYDIGLVIIDSVGLAAGGGIEEQSTALTFFQAAREFITHGATVLAITHMSKQAMSSELKTPIGSIYFENMPRVIWQLISEPDKNFTRIQFVLRKSNVGKLPDFGLNLIFADDEHRVYFEAADNSDLVADKADDQQVVLEVLANYPEGVSMREIVQQTGLSSEEVRSILMRFKKQNKVVYKDKRWFFNGNEDDLPPF